MVSTISNKPLPPPVSGASCWDVDPYDPMILAQPEPFYEELRMRGPLVWLERYGVFATGRYDMVREIFSDWSRFISSRGIGITDFGTETPWRRPSLTVEVDPPYHGKMRKIVARALSARAIAQLRDDMQIHADAMVAALVDRGEFDGVSDLAETFPLEIFPKAVGIGGEGRERLVSYAAISFNFVGPDNDLRREALSVGEEVIPWVNARCEREAIARGSLADTIYHAVDRGEADEEEAALLVRSLLSAGVDTTISGIGNALYCLAEAPSQYAKLRRDPERYARAAFDEGLRRISPVTHFYRTSAVDSVVGGADIPAGHKIFCCLAAANLDSQRWVDPNRYDLDRDVAGHVAFGVGIHNCLGQVIARAEAEALLKAVAARVGGMELTAPPRWRLNNSVRALESLPMRFVTK